MLYRVGAASLLLACFASAPAYAATCTTAEGATCTTGSFSITDYGTYKIVDSTTCGEEYVLYPKGTTAPSLGTSYKYFAVPLDNVIATETVPLTFIEQLGMREKLYAGPQYSTSPCVRQMITDGVTLQYDSYSSDLTSMLLGADAAFVSSWSADPTNPKAICQDISAEVHPLASADWVRFFGAFFNVAETAESVDCDTESRYFCMNAATDEVADSAGKRVAPKVLFANEYDWSAWGSGAGYKINAPAYKLQFIQDAGGEMPDMSAFAAYESYGWTGAFEGYAFTYAQVAEFKSALALADVIIDETYPNGQTLATIEAKYNLTAGSGEVPAFDNGRVYTLDGTMDEAGPPYGGTDWYESRYAAPDAFLSDMLAVMYPTQALTGATSLRYLRDLTSGSINVVTATECTVTDLSTPYVLDAATCSDLGETSPLTCAASSSSNSDDDDVNTNLVAGVVIGGAAVLIIAASVGFYLSKNKPPPPAKSSTTSDVASKSQA